MPKVSVIIPTYNRAHYVKQAVESVLAQTYTDYELIVVDDGSTDQTAAVLKSFSGRIRFISHENLGITANMNIGVKMGIGEYFAMLGDDDLWLPDFLEKQVPVLDRNPQFAFVCSGAYFIDEKGKIFKSTKRGASRPKTFKSLLQENFVSHLTTLVRRKSFDQVGGFDERFETTQDYELWLRLSRQYSFGYTDAPLAKYRVHENNLSRQYDRHLKDHLLILSKKEIIAGLNWFELRMYRARIYYMFMGFYQEAKQFSKAAQCCLKALFEDPLVGLLYWPPETEKFRFSMPYRFLKPYALPFWFWIKQMTRKE